MNLKEERMQILNMIRDGKVTPEEGAKLLSALETSQKSETAANKSATQGKFLRVRVTDMTSGKVKVNVNLPLALVNVGLKMGARFAPDMDGMDLNAIHAAIKGGMQGRIIEVDDEKDNERVEIFVE